VNFDKMANSLLVSVINTGLVGVIFACLMYPRFTNFGRSLALAMVVLLIIDVVLVARDLWRSGTRLRAVGAIALWIPIWFLASMIDVWEGPLYAWAKGNPPQFEIRGAAAFCGLEVYGPEHEKAEWSGDDIGLIWRLDHADKRHFPVSVDFRYGEVPTGFEQGFPASTAPPAALNPAITYKMVVERCMGGAQSFSLRGHALTDYKPNSNVCWGELKVPERPVPAWVRTDCKTKQPIPMSQRAKQRLEEYRQNRIPFY
jgi:hypothetical protein